ARRSEGRGQQRGQLGGGGRGRPAGAGEEPPGELGGQERPERAGAGGGGGRALTRTLAVPPSPAASARRGRVRCGGPAGWRGPRRGCAGGSGPGGRPIPGGRRRRRGRPLPPGARRGGPPTRWRGRQ